MSEATGIRSKRRCAGRRNAQSRTGTIPSAVHYVGYVEDDETPEMIMRKFEELERIRQATADVNDKEVSCKFQESMEIEQVRRRTCRARAWEIEQPSRFLAEAWTFTGGQYPNWAVRVFEPRVQKCCP